MKAAPLLALDAGLLSAVVIGPKAQGRNYGVRRFAGPPLSSEAQARIDDFSMSLTGWAILRLERMAAMFPLTADEQQFAVVRARHIGEGELGPIAVAHLLIVPAAVLQALDWASHRLLGLIPEPEDAAFAAEPPVLKPQDLAAAVPPLEHPPRHAAWTDLTVDADTADPEDVLSALIQSVTPAEQRARLTGWATTSLLAKAGGLDPALLFKLVVHAPAESVADFAETHKAEVLDQPHPSSAAPLPWKTWTRLAAIARADPAAAPLAAARWTPDKARLPAETVAFEAIVGACAGLAPARMVELLRAVARGAAGRDRVAMAIRRGVSETFDAIAQVADAEGVAYYIQAFLTQASAAEIGVLTGLKAMAARPEVATWLVDSVDHLDLDDMAERWAAQLAADPGFLADISLAAPVLQDRVMQACLADLAEPGRRRLAAHLLRLHCGRAADGGLVRRAGAALLAQPPGDADIALADRMVLEAVQRWVPDLMPALTRRAVLPAMRLANDRESLYRAARALLTAEGSSRG